MLSNLHFQFFIFQVVFPPCVVIRGAVLFVPRGTKRLFFVFNLA